MADWTEILNELQQSGGDFDAVRRKYLKQLFDLTGRNVIVYYSAWLQKPGAPQLGINDLDKNAFMATVKGLDRTKGLDLILHTPGGDVAATESIIDYLCRMFDDIRVVVPQLSMSGGTMIACASHRILMGKHSNLGPVDPQLPMPYGQISVQAIIEEFETARKEIKKDPNALYVWQPILNKYTPTLIGECQKAVKWAEHITSSKLEERMFASLSKPDRKRKVKKVMEELGDHSVSLSHGRHISAEKCKEIGLVVEDLEADQSLQDAVLSVHHSIMHTLAATLCTKIVENHNGSAVVQSAPAPQPPRR